MHYQVIKHAFDQKFIDEIESITVATPLVKAGTVENDDYSTRSCDLRWILHGTRDFDMIREKICRRLGEENVEIPGDGTLENLQHGSYGPNGFHDWHLDVYRRNYNKYDLPLGDRLINKKRVLTISILLTPATAFTGGAFEISMFPNGENTVGTALDAFSEVGDAAVFDSALCHRVAPVKSGMRKSLVGWFCA